METKNSITIVVNGRYHAFDYAAQLYREGRLGKLISTMPAFVADRYGIGREAYVGMPIFEVMKRASRRLLNREPPVVWFASTFAKAALRHIPDDTKAIVGLGGYCLEILQCPRFRNAVKIVDRIAAHPTSYQQLNLLAAARHGTRWIGLPEAYRCREMEEYELADRILVPSEFVRRTFLENEVPARKLWKNLYGTSKHKFEGLDDKPLPREPAVLFVGAISPLKGIGVLVNAMEIVRKSVPGAQLWLVGPRNPRFPGALLDRPWIRQFGILRGQALYDKYRSASVFGFLSYGDGFGLVLIEAAQCGLPIVATDHSGALDMFPDGEGLVAPGDSEGAARKIVEYLQTGGPAVTGSWPDWSAYAAKLTEGVDCFSRAYA